MSIRDSRGPERQRGILSDEEIDEILSGCHEVNFVRAINQSHLHAIARAAARKCAEIAEAYDGPGHDTSYMSQEGRSHLTQAHIVKAIREAAGIGEDEG